MRKISRRRFLRSSAMATASGAIALGFSGCSRLLTEATPQALTINRYGDLLPDPYGILDLPEGFTYHAFSTVGERMDDGFLVPGAHDGMAAFPGSNGKTILIRNHELGTGPKEAQSFAHDKRLREIDREQLYDPGKGTKPGLGGTTTLVYDTKTGTLESHHMSLVGTIRNCAGGATPWNTWISCEESVQLAKDTYEKDHGYNFEVPVSATIGLTTPIPLKAMGRFNHEAVAVDPKSGIVYQTEDRHDSLIYRFIPDVPGKLARGGRLQAMAIRDMKSADTRNWKGWADKVFPWTYDAIAVGEKMEAVWGDIQNVESPKDDLRLQGFDKGAARFARGEGMWHSNDSIYFVCTNGGYRKKGQVWRYIPSPFEGTPAEDKQPGTLELFIEPNNSDLLENGDNITVAPWGDLILCEDGPGTQFIVGVTPQGKLYRFAKNSRNRSEFAGATFSPNGSTLFVNIQGAGMTLAITGPWNKSIKA